MGRIIALNPSDYLWRQGDCRQTTCGIEIRLSEYEERFNAIVLYDDSIPKELKELGPIDFTTRIRNYELRETQSNYWALFLKTAPKQQLMPKPNYKALANFGIY